MLNWISISLITAAFWAFSQAHSVALAQTPSEEKLKQCIAEMNERTAAKVANDWLQLERLAKRYLRDRKGVMDSENYSNAHSDIAAANLQIGNAAAALAAIEECIDTFYANPGCHVDKVRALIELKQSAEARIQFGIAERLVDHLIQSNESDLRRASQSLEKELCESKGRNLNAQKSYLDSLRRYLELRDR